jgi:hypothetical protein
MRVRRDDLDRCRYNDMGHISDHNLDRYHLGMVIDEAELAPLEEHLLCCPACLVRAEQAGEDIDTLRAAMVAGNFDLEDLLREDC